jgi:DNA repair exonuclease SbcCD ATPase subunit
MKLSWIIVLALLALVVYLILTRPPSHDDNKAAYLDTLRFLKLKEASIIAQERSIIKRSNDKAESDRAKLEAHDREIQALEFKLRQKRTPRVDTLILDNPELASFVDTQQEIITELKEQVDTLKSALQFREKLFDDLVTSHNAERDISERIGREQDNRIVNLEKKVKKSKRASRWLKAAAITGTIAGLFLGSQL